MTELFGEGREIRSHRATRKPSRLWLALPIVLGLTLIASPASAESRQAQPRIPAVGVKTVTLPSLVAAGQRWWVAPVVGAGCSSPYGYRTFYDTRLGTWRSGMHYGRDLTRYYKAPVRAVANGTVIQAGWRGGYGYAVEIKHGKGTYSSLYGHLAQITVRKGQWVRMGDVIGKMGHSGDADGDHLHFEIRRYGTSINPDAFMKIRGVRLC